MACSSVDVNEDSEPEASYQDEPDMGWALQEDSGAMPLQDMSPVVDVRADMARDARDDMRGDDDMAQTDMFTAVDAGVDMARAEDMSTTSVDCVDEDGFTDWACCVASDLAATGCDICENRFPSEEDAKGCLTCGLFRPEDAGCCSEVPVKMDELGMSNENDPLGCAPWGPPAPPHYHARLTLRDLAPPRLTPSYFRRE